MAQRISRAKQTHQGGRRAVRAAARAPSAPSGCGVVLHVLYLIFNEGYTATSGPDLQRADLTARGDPADPRACTRLLPDDGEVAGLLALMLLTDARRAGPDRRRRRAGPAGRAGPRAVEPRRRSPRASRWSPTRWRAAPLGPVPAAGGDRRRARRGADARRTPTGRRSSRCTSCSSGIAPQPDGHAQPRGRGGDGRTARAPASTLLATLDADDRAGRPPPARRRARPPARDGRRRTPRRATRYRDAPRGARRACPSSATSRPAPRGYVTGRPGRRRHRRPGSRPTRRVR